MRTFKRNERDGGRVAETTRHGTYQVAVVRPSERHFSVFATLRLPCTENATGAGALARGVGSTQSPDHGVGEGLAA